MLSKKLTNNLMVLYASGFMSDYIGKEVLIIENFFIRRFTIDDEIKEYDKNLFNSFHNYMVNKFGDEYVKDFNEFVTEQKKRKQQ